MTDQWTEGEPKSDGLYLVAFDHGAATTIRQATGERRWAIGKYLDGIGSLCTSQIARHIRLPEPQRPLEPPRRFRAKYQDKPVTGCVRPKKCGGEDLLFAFSEECGYVGAYKANDFTNLEWIDP
jgi:hypothetical protein